MFVNKKELAGVIAEKGGFTKKDSEAFLDCFMEAVTETLADGDEIKLTGFGTFGTRVTNARNGVNPQTGEAIKIESRVKPYFKAGKTLRESV